MSLVSVKDEPEWCVSEAAVRAGLYVDHEVKNELVLGPVLLQPPDIAYKLNGHPKIAATAKREPEPYLNTNTNVTTLIKVEPKWETNEREDNMQVSCTDRKIKLEPLGSQQDDLTKNALHPKKEVQNIKQETQNDSSVQTREKTYYGNRLKSEKDKLLLRNFAEVRNADVDKKPHITKPSRIFRTRLRIRYEEDSDSEHLQERVKVKSIRPKKIHKCTYCGKQFAFRTGLTNHIRTHTGEKPYSCQVCSKKFSDYAVLVRHRKVHTGAKPHICDVCGNKYSEKYLLKNHKRVHTGEKTYFCKDCPKTFINSSNYRRHQKVHMHKYCCDICKRQFERKSKLVTHIVYHMKPKPYVCKFCNRTFGQSGHLNRHMAMHKEAREVYACGVCNKQFTQYDSLKKHVTGRVCERKNK